MDRLKLASGLVVALLGVFIFANCGKPYVKVKEPAPSDGPPADKARVYFVLPQGIPSGNAYIMDGEEVIGWLANKMWFYVDLDPGKHLFMSVTSNTAFLDADLEAGKTYHVKVFVTPGAASMLGPSGTSGNVYMVGVAPDTGEDWDVRWKRYEKFQQVKENPEVTDKWQAKYASKNAARLEKFEQGADANVMEASYGE